MKRWRRRKVEEEVLLLSLVMGMMIVLSGDQKKDRIHRLMRNGSRVGS
jgi:hypothetical protein